MSKNTPNKFTEKISSIWGLIMTACSLIGIGFGAGHYVGSTLTDIKRNGEYISLCNQLLDLKESHTKEIEEYLNEIHELRNEIYSLHKEMREKGN